MCSPELMGQRMQKKYWDHCPRYPVIFPRSLSQQMPHSINNSVILNDTLILTLSKFFLKDGFQWLVASGYFFYNLVLYINTYFFSRKLMVMFFFIIMSFASSKWFYWNIHQTKDLDSLSWMTCRSVFVTIGFSWPFCIYLSFIAPDIVTFCLCLQVYHIAYRPHLPVLIHCW